MKVGRVIDLDSRYNGMMKYAWYMANNVNNQLSSDE